MIVVGIDLDGVLAQFLEGYAKVSGLSLEEADKFLIGQPEEAKHHYHQPGFFANLEPYPDRIQAVKDLAQHPDFEVFIVTSAPATSHSFSEKVEWVAKYLGEAWLHRLIFVVEKSRVKLDFLVDDRVYVHLPSWGHCSDSAPAPEWQPILSPTLQSEPFRDQFVCLDDWTDLPGFFSKL